METGIIFAVLGALGLLLAVLDRTFSVWVLGGGLFLLIATAILFWLTLQLERFVAFTPGYNLAWGAGHLLVLGLPLVTVAYLLAKGVLMLFWTRE
jgi:hypothetical protein